eukprot:156555-Rhodomonas_salina.1
MSDTDSTTALDPPEKTTVMLAGCRFGARFAAMTDTVERSSTSLLWIVGDAGRLSGITLVILSAVPS